MLSAKETDPFTSKVISSEYNIVNGGSFNFTIKYKFINTTAFVQNTEFDLPDGWTATVNPAVTGNMMKRIRTFGSKVQFYCNN